MSKIVITPTEVEAVELTVSPLDAPKPPPAIPLWARLVIMPLALVLPVLAVVALILRLALRAAAPRTQQAWHSYMSLLLIVSAFLFTVGAVLLFSWVPSPPQAISSGMTELDERPDFPSLPARMTGVELAQRLRPLVMLASPAVSRWLGRGESTGDTMGAAALLSADATGYLFATAKHVAEGTSSPGTQRVLLSAGLGGWASADLIARHRDLDLALLWLPRRFGSAEFHQPLALPEAIQTGTTVYAIGHPQGLNFTVSSGIVSRTAGDTLQISAPVSPGNSGGPVYDESGNLLGIVIAKMDRTLAPNAENLNFAVNAAVLQRLDRWEFLGDGQQHVNDYLTRLKAPEKQIQPQD